MALRSREGPRRIMTGTTCGMATLAAESELGQVGAIGTEVQRLAGAAGDLGRGSSKSVHGTALT